MIVFKVQATSADVPIAKNSGQRLDGRERIVVVDIVVETVKPVLMGW